jgi:molybdopterin converting factor small subunit
MAPLIRLKLYATLKAFMPPAGEDYPVEPGISVRDLLRRLAIPEEQVKLVFIDGVQARLGAVLKGGERVGLFPPVGGG